MFELTGKTALVTGGNRGLGLAIARGAARAGADVVLVARDAAKLDAGAEEIRSLGRRVWTFAFDLTRIDEIEAFFASVCAEAGEIDLLVNNAGLTIRKPAHDLSLDEWRRVQDTNLNSAYALSRAFARARIALGKPGKILNVTSLMARGSRKSVAAYATSKSALAALTQALAVDWAVHGIQVNAIAPGYFKTDMTVPLYTDEEFSAWVRSRTPMDRWGEPDDLVGAAVFFLSSASDFVTGQMLYVDGGWTAAT
ncbi:SDR family oxidoreductase [Candidatus Sumerlaeota bacterium]|nr:SDR family oxidoreductase [Candidatus Sumerlaeota bacterium]